MKPQIIIRQWSLLYRSGMTDHSKIARHEMQNKESRAEDVLDASDRYVFATGFVRIRFNPAYI
jgi:hypothetical protein